METMFILKEYSYDKDFKLEFETKNSNRYDLLLKPKLNTNKTLYTKYYYDISFKHKNIKGYTNLNEQFLIIGNLTYLLLDFIKWHPEFYYGFTIKDKRLMKFVMCYVNNHFDGKIVFDGDDVYLYVI